MTGYKITITIETHDCVRHTHSVTVEGDGDLEQFLTAYQAGLVAAGFSPSLAERLTLAPRDD